MEASRQQAPPDETGPLDPEVAQFYRRAFSPARAGCINVLRKAGCSEEEAEDVFAETFERVMRTVDPIERNFAVPQMVEFLKKACRRKLIDERRHQGVLHSVPLADASSVSDDASDTPVELAERHEVVAIGREAVASLSDRDRQVFVQRHQMGLEPDEILENFPGLSRRSYRKILQRANARVLSAFEQIDSGARCRDMERNFLQRYISGDASAEESKVVESHLEHCRACQLTGARMRGYLHDVASGLAVAMGATAEVERNGSFLAEVPSRVLDAWQALGEATRSLRERLRDQALRAASSMPGSGGDAAAGQVIGISTAKVAGACVGGAVAAGATCLALGVSPLAVVGLQQDRPAPVERKAERRVPAPPVETPRPVIDPGPTEPPPEPRQEPSRRSPQQQDASSPSQEPVRPASESGAQTEEELGLESTGRPPRSSPPSSSGGESSEPSVGSSSSLDGGGESASPAPPSGGGGEAPVRGGSDVGL